MGNVDDLWDLKADPATIDSLEQAWKAQVKQLSWAADTITTAANRVIGGDTWQGETADRYDQHRRKLVADLDKCAELTGKVAQALGECAQVLRHNQGLLTTEKQKLSGVRSDMASGSLTFYPKNPQETKLVTDATQAANDIRGRVDRELNAQAAIFRSARGELEGYQSTWSARTVTLLNWNIQQGGGGNKMFPYGFGGDGHGTESSDIPDLARRLKTGNVDVATMQEMFRGDAEKLERELNKDAPPGEKWEVHFGKASDKTHLDDTGLPYHGTDDFGNAVVVRTGHGVTTGPTTVTNLTPGDEPRSATRTQINFG